METQQTAWRRARLARDARFDGRFFVGVLTTGIYCRPVCPAPAPKEQNVRYFQSAAAAADAGLRPCLRCRPEVAPGSPAWTGTSATVSRALRLLDEGALDEGGVDVLASRLGIGSRHLRRLFLEHLGATPVAVAQTRRLHFAKRLVDETRLPLTDVALAAGFGSVRRFNAVVRTLYGRTPTELRGLSRHQAPDEAGQYRFLLRFRPPYDWSRLLAFLSPRAIPGVEHVGRDASYGRTISIDGRYGWIAARLAPGTHAVELRVRIDDPRSLMRIVGRARALFDLGADPAQIRAALSDDEWLAPRLAACPGLRVPGAWDRFELTIRAILGQQITVKGATTLAGRLVKSFGEPFDGGEALTHVFPTPARLAGADLSGLGLTRARETTIREFAGAVADGRVTLERPEELRALPGIGDWTVEYVAMRGFGEPDAFPAGDLVLLKTSGLRTRRALVARAEAWRPWRAYAAMHLWQGA